MPAPPDIGVKGKPIRLAEPFQRLMSTRGVTAARRQHHRPMRCHKPRPRTLWCRCVGRTHDERSRLAGYHASVEFVLLAVSGGHESVNSGTARRSRNQRGGRVTAEGAARQSRNRRLNRLKGLNELNEENDIGNFVAGCEEIGLLQCKETRRLITARYAKYAKEPHKCHSSLLTQRQQLVGNVLGVRSCVEQIGDIRPTALTKGNEGHEGLSRLGRGGGVAAKRIEWAQKLRGENCRKLATDLDCNGAEGRPLPSDGRSFVPNCRKRGNEFLTSSSGLIGGREVGRAFGATEGLDTATRQAAAGEGSTPYSAPVWGTRPNGPP